MTLHQVYLIPGFFGFSSIGGLSYFRQVPETLEDVLVRRGVQVELIEVRTLAHGEPARSGCCAPALEHGVCVGWAWRSTP
jgi:hypothetical protein